MFPNAVMMKPGDLERHPRRHDRRPRRPRLAADAGSQSDGRPPQTQVDQWHEETPEHRPRRLRLHGPDALQRLQARQRLLRPRLPPGAQGRLRPDADKAKAFADKWGYESVETDWRKLVERKDIDAIDICTPNNTHAEIAIAAAEAGKMVLCEKPLSMDRSKAQKMVEAVEKAGVPNTVWYNYRRVPAVTLAKQLDRRGPARPDLPLPRQLPPGLDDLAPTCRRAAPALWRLDVAAAGSGVTGDLLAHCIDTALWLNGPINTVTAMTETFVKERKHNLTGKVEPVGIDDACASSAGSTTARSASSSRPATPAATRRSTRSRSTARTPRSSGTCTTCTGSHYFDHGDEARSAAGGRSTSPTATIPT